MAGIFGDDDSLYLGLEDSLPTAEELLRGRRDLPTAEELLAAPAPAPTRRFEGQAIAATGAEFELAPGDPDDTETGSVRGQSAPLSVFPTSTTDPSRPRTLAAGYNHTSKTLTVMFRDGTLYNYYEVSTSMWNAFKRTFSKGVWIRQNLDVRGSGLGEKATGSSQNDSLYAAQIRNYGSTLQSARKGVQFKSDIYKPGQDKVKLSGYQNQVRRLMRQGASAEQAISAARAKINADFYKRK